MKITIGNDEVYIDHGLKIQLDALNGAVHQDLDGLMYVFGREGSGKTTLAFQIAKYLDKDFNIDKVAWTPEQFISLVKRAKQYDCIVLDEAYLTFANSNRMNHFQKVIIGLLTMIRSKNLFIIIVSPTFFDLNKYLIVHRSFCAIRVYFKSNLQGIERGFWEMYGDDSKLKLYIRGRKDNNLSVQKADIRGRFTKWFPIDKKEYNERKNAAVLELQSENEKKEVPDLTKIKKHRIEGAIWMVQQLDLCGMMPYGGKKTAMDALRMKTTNFNNKLNQYREYSPFSSELSTQPTQPNYNELKKFEKSEEYNGND